MLGGVELSLCPSKEVGAPRSPLLALQPGAFQVLVAAAARIITAKGADPVAIAHNVDRTLSYALPETQDGINKLLGLFENALSGLLFDGRIRPFTFLSAEAQDGVLESWRRSSITLRRAGYQALRRLTLAAYYIDESSWAALDYHPPSGTNAMAYDDSMVGTPEWIRAQVSGEQP